MMENRVKEKSNIQSLFWRQLLKSIQQTYILKLSKHSIYFFIYLISNFSVKIWFFFQEATSLTITLNDFYERPVPLYEVTSPMGNISGDPKTGTFAIDLEPDLKIVQLLRKLILQNLSKIIAISKVNQDAFYQ